MSRENDWAAMWGNETTCALWPADKAYESPMIGDSNFYLLRM